jgi:hypothetical protein
LSVPSVLNPTKAMPPRAMATAESPELQDR